MTSSLEKHKENPRTVIQLKYELQEMNPFLKNLREIERQKGTDNMWLKLTCRTNLCSHSEASSNQGSSLRVAQRRQAA